MERTYSRDFTYIDNVIQANELAAITPSDEIRERLNNYFGQAQSAEREAQEDSSPAALSLSKSVILSDSEGSPSTSTMPSAPVGEPARRALADGPVEPQSHIPTDNDTSPAVTEPVEVQPIFEVFNVAYGQSTTLFTLFEALRSNLAKFDPTIAKLEVKIGEKRQGDIPHSLASVDKIKAVLEYEPKYSAVEGFYAACNWYYENLK